MLTSAFSSHAFSEEDKPSLPPVVVTAARTPQLQSDALLHTTVITAQQIRDSQAPDLPSLLSREAGLQITQSGGVGSATGMFLRGADTDDKTRCDGHRQYRTHDVGSDRSR